MIHGKYSTTTINSWEALYIARISYVLSDLRGSGCGWTRNLDGSIFLDSQPWEGCVTKHSYLQKSKMKKQDSPSLSFPQLSLPPAGPPKFLSTIRESCVLCLFPHKPLRWSEVSE